MPQLNAYLSFDGNCADAMAFYAELFGAKLEAMIAFDQMPGGPPVPAEHAKKIMHAHLVHRDFALMAGDMPPGMTYQGIKGVMMTLSYPAADEAKRVFAALAEGGSVQMPLGETFWAEAFGMCTDRFGTPWGVNGGLKPPGAAGDRPA
jgi:PhnB protein